MRRREPDTCSAEASGDGPRLSALVLSHGADAVEGWRLQLELDGYDVRVARDDKAALATLSSPDPPDIAVLDSIHDPEEVVRLLAQLARRPVPTRTAILVSRPCHGPESPGDESGTTTRLELLAS